MTESTVISDTTHGMTRNFILLRWPVEDSLSDEMKCSVAVRNVQFIPRVVRIPNDDNLMLASWLSWWASRIPTLCSTVQSTSGSYAFIPSAWHLVRSLVTV